MQLLSKTNSVPVERPEPMLSASFEEELPAIQIVNLPMPRAARNLSLTVSTLVLAGFVAIAVIPVSKVVTTTGRVVSKEPTVLVQPLDQSIVRSIEVQPGDIVRAGQIVAKLDPTFTGADRDAMAAQVSALQAHEMRLRAEVEDRPFAYTGPDPTLSLQAAIFGQRQADYNSRLESYRHKIDSLSATTVRLRSDMASYKSRVEYAQEAVNVRKELEQLKLGSKLNSLQALDLLAEAQRNLASTEHAAAAAQQDLAALVAERNSFVQSWHSEAAEKLADVVSKLSDAREALSKAQLRNQLVELRAPRDATVMSVSKISVGSVVSPGQQIMSLVSTEAPIEIEANIPGSEDGYVQVGDTVAIKFDTLPYVLHGMAHGVVRTVSPDSFTLPDEQRNPTGMALPPANASSATGVWYRSRITLDRVGLHDLPSNFRLVPGMPVVADIRVDKRTVLKYLIGRAVPLFTEGMREP